MGIQGFTKFITDRAHEYFENYNLHDCTVVIDGHSISCQLYNWKPWQFNMSSINCYGGDYDKYAYVVKKFFGMLQEVQVKPIVIFDGGFEQRKLPTILRRMSDKIKIADKLNRVFENNYSHGVVFPLFLRECFKDVLRYMDIKMVMCDYEGDSEIANVAKTLNCPVITFDSDYFLFGVQYIPFKTVGSRVRIQKNWRTGSNKFIECKLYRIEKFLESFEGLNENKLYLLPALLGSDYVFQEVFDKFLRSIDANVTKQASIQIVLDWLRKETTETAIMKIIHTFNSIEAKLLILNKIENIVTAYYYVESDIFKYLNIKPLDFIKDKKIDFDNIRKLVQSEPTNIKQSDQSVVEENDEKTSYSSPIEINAACCSENSTDAPLGNTDTNIEETSGNNSTNELLQPELDLKLEESHSEKDNTPKNSVSEQFHKNFTKCLYPSSFMDIVTQNKYYCIPQVENHDEGNSHICSFDILRAIHKILTNSQGKEFIIVARNVGTEVKWFPQKDYSIKLPSLEEIEQLPLQARREVLFQILSIDSAFMTLLEQFSTEWHTFLISLKYAASKKIFESPLVFSLVLCFITLNYVDQRIGYYRSGRTYENIYCSYMQNLPPRSDVRDPFRVDKNCFYYFPKKDCIIYMRKIINMFSVNPKETSDTFDKHLVHQMAQVQSVLLHIKYLNSLLRNPYPDLIIHKMFDATLIYNLTKIFKDKCTDVQDNYYDGLFRDFPCILDGFRYVINLLNKELIL